MKKQDARRRLLATQCIAWAISQWAEQFTSPNGTLRFPNADARRALECRLYMLAALTHSRWTLLNKAEKSAVELLFTATLGPGMREAWVRLRNRGQLTLLPAHNLARYPKAAEVLHLVLRTLSANGLDGQIDKDKDGQGVIFEQLDSAAVVIDRYFRKQSDPSKDMTWEEMCDHLSEALDKVRPSAERGLKTLQAAKKGHAKVHGTADAKALRWGAILNTWHKIRAQNPAWSLAAVDGETAKAMKVGLRTVQRIRQNYLHKK